LISRILGSLERADWKREQVYPQAQSDASDVISLYSYEIATRDVGETSLERVFFLEMSHFCRYDVLILLQNVSELAVQALQKATD